MSGKHIEMFRVKVHSAKQGRVSPPRLSHSKRVGAMVKCITDKPGFNAGDAALKWRIGEVRVVSRRANKPARFAFQFGRTVVENESYDERGQFYRRKNVEHAKHTMVYMDVRDESRIFAGIRAPKQDLATGAVQVANALKRLINRHFAESGQDAEVSIDPVYDTEGFELRLWNAYAVTELSVSFGRPNDPLDVKGMLYGPATKITEEMGGNESIHTIKGESLKGAADFAKSAAEGGFPVSARIKGSAEGKSEKISTTKQRLEKVDVDEGEEGASVFRKIAAWFERRKGGGKKS